MGLLGKKKSDDVLKKPTVKLTGNDIQAALRGNHIAVVSATDVGRYRTHNEDCHLVMNLNSAAALRNQTIVLSSTDGKGTLLMVTDGMGGAAAGDIASRTVKDTLESWFRRSWCKESLPEGEFPTILQNSIKEANRRVFKMSQKNIKYNGMGATVTAAGILKNQLFLAQVGDSRGYLKRDGKLIQVTKDQSLVNKLVESGNITKEEARKHLAKNVILQAIGVSDKLEMGFYTLALQPDDIVLLCSDGLSDMLPDSEISAILGTKNDLLTSVRELIKAANNAGGKDNITIILAKFNKGAEKESKEGGDAGETRKVDLGDIAEIDNGKTSRYIVPPDERE